MAKKASNSSKNIDSLDKKIDAINKKISKTTNNFIKSTADSYEDVVDYGGELITNLLQQKNIRSDIYDLDKKITDQAAESLRLREKGLDAYAEESDMATEMLKYQKRQAENTEKLLKLKEKETKELMSMTKEQKRSIELQKKYNKYVKESLGVVDQIASALEEIPVVGNLLSKAFDTEDLRDKLAKIATKQLGDVKAGVSSIGTGFKTVGAAVSKLLLPILGLVAAFKAIEFAVDIDKETTELARNLGVSKDEAHDLHHEMINISKESDNALMTIKNQTDAMIELGKATGMNAAATKDMVNNQVLLTNNLGLAAEDAAMLNKELKLSGVNIEDATVGMINVVEEFNKASGAGLNVKETLQDVVKVSSRVKANFKGNTKELVLQVAKAKSLGLSLDKIYEMGEASLDVEQSLGAEMEANVLTGKSMNLNEFRQAALVGDTNKMMEELVKNAGTYNEFQNMDLISRKAISKAFGMTDNELADMLKQQELLTALGVKSLDQATEQDILNSSLSADKKEELLQQLKIADTSEKMAKTMESLKNVFAGFATALQPVIDIFTWLVDQTTLLRGIIFSIGGFMAGKMLVSAYNTTAEFVKQVAQTGILQTLKSNILGISTEQLAADTLTTEQKSLGLAADKSSEASKLVQAETTTFQLGEQTALVFEEEAGAAAEVISAEAKGSQVVETGAAVVEQGVLTAEQVTGAVAATTSATAMSFGAMLPVILAGAAAVGAMLLMDDGVVSPAGPDGYSRVLTGPEGSVAINDDDTVVTGTNLNQNSNNSVGNSEVVSLLKELIAKVDQPVKINISGKVIEEIESQSSIKRTYNTKLDNGYGAFG